MNKLTAFFGRHQGRILQFTLGGIMVLFIVIMIAVYLIAKQANPIILDETGKPLHSTSEHKSNY